MAYRIPPELIEKLTHFEVSIDHADPNYQEFIDASSSIDRLKTALNDADIIISTYVGTYKFNKIPLLTDDVKEELLTLLDSIVSQDPNGNSVDLGGHEDSDISTWLRYSNKVLSIEVTDDDDYGTVATFNFQEHIIKIINAMIEYIDRCEKIIQNYKNSKP